MANKFLMASLCFAGLTGSVLAADLPSRAAPPIYVPPVPIFTWAGLYVGGQIGYTWGKTTATEYNAAGAFFVNDGATGSDGVVGGAHLGYNRQFNQFVLGLEGDIEGSSLKGTGFNPSGTVSGSGNIPVEGSIRGRAGIAFDRLLVYATGGVALVDAEHTFTNVFTGTTDRFSKTGIGWTVGGGLDYAVTNNWSVRVEYRYIGFGNSTYLLPNTTGIFPGGPYASHHKDTNNTVRVGFSYKFDTFAPFGPVVAKY